MKMFHLIIGVAFLGVLLIPIGIFFLMLIKSVGEEIRDADYKKLQRMGNSQVDARSAHQIRLVK
jgi:hypothetical protein